MDRATKRDNKPPRDPVVKKAISVIHSNTALHDFKINLLWNRKYVNTSGIKSTRKEAKLFSPPNPAARPANCLFKCPILNIPVEINGVVIEVIVTNKVKPRIVAVIELFLLRILKKTINTIKGSTQFLKLIISQRIFISVTSDSICFINMEQPETID